jgi:hypothetical protein
VACTDGSHVVDLILAMWAPAGPTETTRVRDVEAAKKVVNDLEPDVTWALFEKRTTRWHVRRAGKTVPGSSGCFNC